MRRPSSTALVALLASATFFGGAALAQSDQPETSLEEPTALPSPRAFDSEVQTLTVSSAAFSSRGVQPDSFRHDGGGYVHGTAAASGCLKAPVQLPHGSRVNSVVFHVFDNTPSELIFVLLDRKERNGGSTIQRMASALTSDAGQSAAVQTLTDDTVDFDVVDNDEYQYFLSTCVRGPELRLYSVQVRYQEEADPHSPVVVPVTPFRAYDSRFVDGPLGEGENRLVTVRRSIDIETGAVIKNNAVPVGATAVFFNLAVTNTTGAGFLAATPGNATDFSSASINWSATGQTFNNGTFVELDGNRRIRAFVGGTPGAETDFVIDITGYVLPGD